MPELVEVQALALIPTQAGCGVFLGDGDKAIVIHIDPAIGATIHSYLNTHESARPLSYDLYRDTLTAFGGSVSRLIIISIKDEVYYARLFLEAENEIMERKVVELDCRPSDGIAIATCCGAPIYVLRQLWEQLEDQSVLLKQLEAQSDNHGFPDC